jgi:hypothetical protein
MGLSGIDPQVLGRLAHSLVAMPIEVYIILTGILEIYGPGVNTASNRNEYQESYWK